jgi:hypothetical protein
MAAQRVGTVPRTFSSPKGVRRQFLPAYCPEVQPAERPQPSTAGALPAAHPPGQVIPSFHASGVAVDYPAECGGLIADRDL